jgi:hypothetical protein
VLEDCRGHGETQNHGLYLNIAKHKRLSNIWAVCGGICALFGEAEVDDVDERGLLAESDQEIVRLDVAVNKVLGVHVLDAGQLRDTTAI